MHVFYTLHIHILSRHKIDVINSNVHRNERNLVPLVWRKSLLWNRCFQNVSEYDHEIPQSHTADNPRHHEEESKNIYSNKTSVRQKKKKNQPAHSSSSRWLQN